MKLNYKLFLPLILLMLSFSSVAANLKNISCLSDEEKTNLKAELIVIVEKYDIQATQDRFIEAQKSLFSANQDVDKCESKKTLIKELGGVNNCDKYIDEYNRLAREVNLLATQLETLKPLGAQEVYRARVKYPICE